MSLTVCISVASAFAFGTKPTITYRAGFFYRDPCFISAAIPVVITKPIIRINKYLPVSAVRAIPSFFALRTNGIIFGIEGTRIAFATNPIMRATISRLTIRNTSAFRTTETDTIGAHVIEGKRNVI